MILIHMSKKLIKRKDIVMLNIGQIISNNWAKTKRITNYQKAQAIIKHYEEKQDTFATCLKAGICPICGSSLKLVMEKHIISAEKIKILFWFYTIQKEKRSEFPVVKCPNKCAFGIGHDLGYIGYENCADPTIREYHNNHYGYGDE